MGDYRNHYTEMHPVDIPLLNTNRDPRQRLHEKLKAIGHASELRPGGTLMVLCPFHEERTPSLKVWPNGSWFCHGCHQGGPLNLLLAAFAIDMLPTLAELEAIGQLRLPFPE